MNPKPTPHLAPPLRLMIKQLLLAEEVPVTTLLPGLMPQFVALPAAKVTVLIRDLIPERGYRHGGLND